VEDQVDQIEYVDPTDDQDDSIDAELLASTKKDGEHGFIAFDPS
jgi:hypothetical protein